MLLQVLYSLRICFACIINDVHCEAFRLLYTGTVYMVTYDEYFRDVLTQILDSHEVLSNLEDHLGDLEIIHREILKITALFQTIIHRVESSKNPRSTHTELASIAEKYIKTYSFEREIEIMMPLYSQDTNRIHNIRFKILESFDDRKLVSKIKHLMEDLE